MMAELTCHRETKNLGVGEVAWTDPRGWMGPSRWADVEHNLASLSEVVCICPRTDQDREQDAFLLETARDASVARGKADCLQMDHDAKRSLMTTKPRAKYLDDVHEASLVDE